MRFKNILLAIGMVSFVVPAYTQKIDSLEALLPDAADSEKAKILLDVAYEYKLRKDYLTCIDFGEQGYDYALESGDTLQLLRGGRLLGQAYRSSNNLQESLKAFERVIAIAERHRDTPAFYNEYQHINAGIAITHTFLANYDEALKYNALCLSHLRKYGKRAHIGLCLNNIGLIYYKLKNYKKAQKYFAKSTAIKKEINDLYDLNVSLTNEALCYAYLGNYENAQTLIREVFDLCGNQCSEHDVAQGNFVLGVVFFGLKDFKKAENHFLKSILSAEHISDVRYQLDNVDYLCQIYLAQGNDDRAAFYLHRAERLMNNTSFNLELLKVYSRFFQFFTKKGDFRNAAHYQQKYINLKDSVYNEELTNNLMKIEADYLERENKARLAAQEEVLALNTRIIRNQKLTNIISIALAIVVIAFALVLFKQYVRKKRDNTRLDQRVRERTHELELNRETLLKSLDERDFILGQINAEVRDALSRFRGITSLSVAEVADPVARQYLDEVGKTAEDLSVNIGNYFSCEKTQVLS